MGRANHAEHTIAPWRWCFWDVAIAKVVAVLLWLIRKVGYISTLVWARNNQYIGGTD